LLLCHIHTRTLWRFGPALIARYGNFSAGRFAAGRTNAGAIS
jgi:hypothetical protein